MIKKLLFSCILLFSVTVNANPLTEPATLREKIPSDALAYVRIPNPLDFFALLAPLSDQEDKKIANLSLSLYKNLLKNSKSVINPVVASVLHRLRSPLEVVLLLPPNMPINPALANTLTSVKVDIQSFDELNQILKELEKTTPTLKIVSPINAEGFGALTFNPLFIFVNFDLANHTLNVVSGLATNQKTFQETLKQLQPITDHPMYVLENRVDTGHQGFFTWLNLKQIVPTIISSMSPSEIREIQKWGLDGMRGAAIGWGKRDGKGKLQVMVDVPRAGYLDFFPAVTNQWTLTTAGKPGLVFGISIPALKWLKGVEKILETESSAKERKSYQEFKNKFQKELGFSLEEALDALGQGMIFFTDEVGEFVAIKVGDDKLVDKILTNLVKKYALTHELREFDGKKYHHLVVAFPSSAIPVPKDSAEEFAITVLKNLKSHYYWVEDEGFLIFAQVPQALRDRQRHTRRVMLQEWLAKNQKQDISSALTFISTTLSDTPRGVYYAYLQILTYLADFSQEKLDLFTLPSAVDLKLVTQGTYGLQLDVAESLIGMEWTFENNPLEFFMSSNSNSMMAVAVIGILAAVAIPAYNDYLKRAKVAEGVALLAGLKTPAEEFFITENRLPEVKEIGGKTSGKYVKNIRLLDTKDGYAAEFNDPAIQGTLKLLFDKKTQEWTCTHEGMNTAYLPSYCK